MSIFDSFRRRIIRRFKHRRRYRPILMERLEDRLALSWLTVISHGHWSDPSALEHIGFALVEAYAQHRLSSPTKTELRIGANDLAIDSDQDFKDLETAAINLADRWGRVNGVLPDKNRIIFVDWSRDTPGPFAGAGLADSVGARLGLVLGYLAALQPSLVGVHFIGHSRGSFVVSTAAAVMQERNQSVNSPSLQYAADAKTVVQQFPTQLMRDPATLKFYVTTLDPQPYPGPGWGCGTALASGFACVDLNGKSDGILDPRGVRRWENYYRERTIGDVIGAKTFSGATVQSKLPEEYLEEHFGQFGLRKERGHSAVLYWYAEAVARETGWRPEGHEKVSKEPHDLWSYCVGPFSLFCKVGVDPGNRPWRPELYIFPGEGGTKTPPGEEPPIEDRPSCVAPNDDFAPPASRSTGTIRVPNSRVGSISGNIDCGGDIDRFSVHTAFDGSLVIDVTSLDGRLDPYIVVTTPSGQRFGSNQDGTGASARRPFTNVKAGTVYTVDVYAAGGGKGGYRLTASQITQSAPLVPGPAPPKPVIDDFTDLYENAVPIALPAGVPATRSGTIDGGTHPDTFNGKDHDWFRVTVPKDGKLKIELSTPKSKLDGHIRIHASDVNRTLLVQGPGPLIRPVTAGQIFFIDIGAALIPTSGREATGQYTLRVSMAADSAIPPEEPIRDSECAWLGNLSRIPSQIDNGNGSSNASIDDPADVKWFQINGSKKGNMEVIITPVNDDLKPFVRGFRCDGSGIDSDSGEFDGEARIGFEVGEAERIIVAVSSHDSRYTGGFTVSIGQPDKLPDDDVADFGEEPRDLSAQVTQEGDGSFRARIEKPDDNDWFKIPIRGAGFFTIEVSARDSALVPFLELNRDGTSSGFFESDDGRDGKAKITYLPSSCSDQCFVWAKLSSLDGTQGSYTLNVWRTQNPDDDYPDAGGVFLSSRTLSGGGQIFIPGRIEHPVDSDNFHIRVDQPGPVAIQIISLTEGFVPSFSRARQHGDPNQRTGTSGGDSGRGGRTFEMLPDILPSPDNWIVIDVKAEGGTSPSPVPFGDYIVHVWQPLSANDQDADTVGIEASPILVDGKGNGRLPGTPNDNDPSAGLNHAGDKDVFQVRAVSNRPITFTVTGLNTFLRIHDSAGRSIATDHNSGPNGASQITLEANIGDLFYLEVTAFNGTDTGLYTIEVNQPADDHPDAPIFHAKTGQTRDATPIILDSTGFGQASGNIETELVGDRDMFKVQSAARGQFTVDVVTTDDKLDTQLRVYDSRGNLVATDDDGGDSRNSHVTFSTFMGETYQIEVSGYGDNSVGAYRVTVQSSPLPRRLFVGTYDDFGDSRVSDEKWIQQISGRASVLETGGYIQLLAEGSGANDPNNGANLMSRATISGDVEFDFNASLGTEESLVIIEIADPGAFVHLRMDPDGAGGIRFSVEGSGYEALQNLGPQPLTAGVNYHVKIEQAAEGIGVYLNGVLVSRFAGSIRPNSWLRSSVSATRLPLFDDFNDGVIDDRWNIGGDGVVEGDGRLHLWMYRDGGLRRAVATTERAAGGHDIVGFKLNSDRTAGTVGGGQAESEVSITNGTDSIVIKWLNDVNQFVLRATGYYGSGDQFRWDPDAPGPAETPDGPLEIRPSDSGIEILHNNTRKFFFGGKSIQPGSYFRAEAFGQNGEGGPLNRDYEMTIDDLQLYTTQSRFAQLELDNVQGTFALPPDPVAKLYDGFNDSQVDRTKWHVAGTVEEADGILRLPLFLGGEPVTGYVTSAGIPEGTNIRGFRLGSNRTGEPRRLCCWDTDAKFGVTNGVDFIEIEWNLKEYNRFDIVTGGAYGSRIVPVVGPSDENSDGPWEVRERDNNIEILHNGSVKLTIPGTIRAGSYFQFRTHGNPSGGNMTDPPETFHAIIDELELYVDPEPYDLQLAPAMKSESDAGASDTDHVTNKLSLDFAWPAGPEGTQYQWREGELLDDGSIQYDPWSSPQAETTAHVDLPHASVHVISVRPIGTDGIAGAESARGFIVDTLPPTVTSYSPQLIPAAPLELNTLTLTLSEPVDAASVSLTDVVTFTGPNGDLIDQLTNVSVDGTAVIITLNAQTSPGLYELVIGSDIRDTAGNAIDQDADGNAGEEVEDRFTATVRINATPVAADTSVSTDEDVPITIPLSPLIEDPDGSLDSMTLTIVTAPSNGTLSVNWNVRSVTYSPGQDFVGSDRFVYNVTDTDGAVSSAATVTINVAPVNDPPSDVQVANLAVDENTPGAVLGSVSATDPDLSDTHVFQVSDGRFEIVQGQLKLKDNQQLNYEIESVVNVKITATDSGSPPLSLEKSFVLTVNDLNDAPVLANPSNKTVDEKSTVSFTLTATDADMVAGVADTVSYSIVSGNQPGMSLNGTSGMFRWTPTEAQDGQFTLVIRATDNHNLAGTDQTVTVTVNEVNDPPVLANPGNKIVDEKTALSFMLSATDSDVVAGVADSIMYSIVSGNLPGMLLNDATGDFSWTPTESQDGQHIVVFRAKDNHNAAGANQTLTITVGEVNDPPVLANPGNKTPDEKTVLRFSLSATDGDTVAGVADTVSYSIVTGNLPGMTLNGTTGDFSWTPTEALDGQHVVVFRTKDNHNLAGTDQTVTITVGEVNDPPVLANPGNMTRNEKAELSFSLAATDGDIVAGAADAVAYSIFSGSLPGMTLDGATGAFSWTPTEAQDGQHVVVFRAKDNHDAAGTDQTITITVGEVNDPPVLANPGNKTLNEKTELSFSLAATDGDIVAGNADTVAYSIFSGSLPGMTLDGATGAFSWTPIEAQDGQHVVVFRAKDNHDAAGTDQTITVTVSEVNDAPVLANPGNKTLNEKTDLSFSLPATDGDIVAGAADTVAYSIFSGSLPGMTLDGATGAFSWPPTEAQDGQHVVVFRAKDNHDAAGTDQTITITVGEVNDPPVLANPGNKTLNEKTELSFSLAATDGDIVAGIADTVSYSIVTGNLPGMTLDDATGDFRWTPTEAQDGQHVVVFRAKDNHNLAETDQTVTIIVGEVNDPPVLANPGTKTIDEKTALSFMLSAADSDVVAGVADSIMYSIVSGNLPGMVLNDATGDFSWTPTESQDGQHIVVLRAKDNHDAAGANQTVTITVGEVNDPPVLANPGNKTPAEKAALSFSLSATDGDTVAGVADTVSYSIVTGNLPGMTLNGTTGDFSWTPTESQDGQHVVVFRAKDNHDAAGADQTVTITVGEVNDPPVLANPGNKTPDEKATLSFSLSATDGDTVAGVADTVSYSIVTGNLPGMTLNTTTGQFSWTPTESQDGQHVVVFRAKDNHNLAGTDQTVTITVGEVNDPPLLTNPGNNTPDEKTELSFSLSAADGDIVAGVADTVTYSIASGNLPGMSLDDTTGAFSWTPTEAQDGQHVVVFHAKDNHNAQRTDQTVTITVVEVNDPPVLAGTGNKNTAEGTALSFTLSATDGDTVAGVADTVTYSIASGNLPGMSLDDTTGAFSWTSTEAQDGQHVIVLRAKDNHDAAGTDQTITITVDEVNDAPVLANPGNKTLNEKTELSFLLTATDGDIVAGAADTVVYSIFSGSLPGMTLNAATGEFSWTPIEAQDGQHVVVFGAKDNHDAAGTDQTITITVGEVNDAPVLADPGNKTLNERTELSFSLTSTDGDIVAGVADTVSYSFVSGSLPGMTLDGATGAFSWTPTEAQDGEHAVVFGAKDNHDVAGADQTITITVGEVNDPPTTIRLAGSSLKENISGATVGTLSATDPDSGQTHTFTTADPHDPQFEIVDTTLKLKLDAFVVGATVNVEVTATDSGNPPQAVTQTIVINVIANPHAWLNVALPLDANGDIIVTPLDALVIINQLNDPTILGLGGHLPDARPETSTSPFYDVNGDGFCTPIDVLLIINFLNNQQAEGETDNTADPLAGSLVFGTAQGTIRPPDLTPRRSQTSLFGVYPMPRDSRKTVISARARIDHPERRAGNARSLESEVDTILDDIADDVTQAWFDSP